MIHGILYDNRDRELQLLDRLFRNEIALYGNEESRVDLYQNGAEFEQGLQSEELADFLCADVTTEEGIRCAELMRHRYPHAGLLVIADAKTSPMQYIRPSIMATSVIIRPSDVSATGRVVREFFQFCMAGRQEETEEYFVIQEKDNVTRIPFDRISCFEASLKRILVRLSSTEYSYYETLDHLEQTLPDQFVRCHRGFIVNIRKVVRFVPAEGMLYLEGNMQVPVSRSCRQKVMEAMR